MQRWVTRRATMILTEDRALTVDYRSGAWGEPPYNLTTAYRPDFDAWLAEHAVAASATLVTSTTVTGLLRDGDRADGAIVGVRNRPSRRRPDRPRGHRLRRGQLVRRQGGRPLRRGRRRQLHPGVKETIALPRG